MAGEKTLSLRADGTPDCDIAPETALRVLEVAKRHNYRPSRFASGLRSGKRFLLGVITPDISNYAFAEAGRVIEELAYHDGYSVMFGSSTESASRMNELLDIFIDHGVDGIIVTPCSGCRPSLSKAVSLGIPVVLINRDIPTISYVSQSADKVGTQAYWMLQDMMAGKEPGKVIIPPEMHFGGSSAPR